MHQPAEGLKLTRREMPLTGATSVAVTLAPSAAAVTDKAMARKTPNAPVNAKVSLTPSGKLRTLKCGAPGLLLIAWLAFPALAQESASGNKSAEEIARQLADPGAAMISVPFQYNYLGDVGPGGAFNNHVLKVQPVIPFIGEHGKFLLRPILPLVSNEFPLDKGGVGDLFVQGYYIPHREGGAVEFGFGPAMVLDTASNHSLGSGKWSIGPAFVLVHKTADRKWTMAALANHVWSVAGEDDREDVSQTSLQPLLTRSLPDSWSLTFSSEMSYNWRADAGNAWTLPVGISVAKVVKLGHRPVSFGLGGLYNVDRPDSASRWTARLTITLVFPE